jgi:tRNA A37 threonylcarbamoyladenosine dehydratase
LFFQSRKESNKIKSVTLQSNKAIAMQQSFQRTQMLLGTDALLTLAHSHVAVFGVGGVGGYVVEVLARSGVGALDIFDNDLVDETNINRQIIALHSTIGKPKVEVMRDRVLDINPQCQVNVHRMFYLPENADEVDLKAFNYVVDCIDTVAAKLELIRRCDALQVPLICAMGAANKLNPMGFKVVNLSQTNMDPLAKILRKKLRREGIAFPKVVYSEETPLPSFPIDAGEGAMDDAQTKRPVPASNAFVPAAAGLLMGSEVVKDLLRQAGTLRPDAE